MTYSLYCFSFDGDHVIEGRPFNSIHDAWNRCSEMGSRWFFFPIPMIVANDVIIDCCDEINSINDFRGESIQQFSDFLANHQELVQEFFS